jgi:hypothetical protein
MTAGFESINDAGTYQITDSYPNVQFKSKATVTMSSTTYVTGGPSFGDISFYYYDVVVTGAIYPVVALASTDFVSLTKLTISGTTWTYRIASAVAATITYYVFDRAPTTANYGLEIYDASGNLTFSSASKNMDMKSYLSSFTYYTPSGAAAYYASDITMTSGRTYAIVPGPSGNQYMSIGVSTPGKNPGDPVIYNGSTWGYFGGTKVVSNVITHRSDAINYHYTSDSIDPGVGININYGNILVVDVTGL